MRLKHTLYAFQKAEKRVQGLFRRVLFKTADSFSISPKTLPIFSLHLRSAQFPIPRNSHETKVFMGGSTRDDK